MHNCEIGCSEIGQLGWSSPSDPWPMMTHTPSCTLTYSDALGSDSWISSQTFCFSATCRCNSSNLGLSSIPRSLLWLQIWQSRKNAFGLLVVYYAIKGTGHLDKCRRTDLFSLGVSENMHQIANVWKFWLNLSSNLQENIKRNPLFFLCFQMLYKRLRSELF